MQEAVSVDYWSAASLSSLETAAETNDPRARNVLLQFTPPVLFSPPSAVL